MGGGNILMLHLASPENLFDLRFILQIRAVVFPKHVPAAALMDEPQLSHNTLQ